MRQFKCPIIIYLFIHTLLQQELCGQGTVPVQILNRHIINQNFIGDQHKVSVAINRKAEFVVAWVDKEANILYSRTGDRFGSLSDVVVVDDHSGSEEAFARSGPSTSIDENYFGIAWQAYSSVYAKRFDLSTNIGLPKEGLGGTNAVTDMDPSIIVGVDGAMVINYDKWGGGMVGTRLHLDFFSKSGLLFPNFLGYGGSYITPDMDANQDREGVIVYSYGDDSGGNPGGEAVSYFAPGNLNMGSYSLNTGNRMSVAYLGNKEMLLTWQTPNGGIHAQKYSGFGKRLFEDDLGLLFEEEIIVDTDGTYPSIDADENGNFSIAYIKNGPPDELVLKHYDSEGNLLDTKILYDNQSMFHSIDPPELSINKKGEFVVAWSDNLSAALSEGADQEGMAVYVTLGVIPFDNAIVPDQKFTIIEAIKSGDPVGEVEAYIPNIESFGFEIISGNSGDAFIINAETGELSINKRQNLSFDSPSQIDLEIELSDGITSYSDIIPIYLNLKPEISFGQTSYSFEDSENWNIPFTISDPEDDSYSVDFYSLNRDNVKIVVDGDDPDQYHLTPPADGFKFEVDKIQLQLVVEDEHGNISYSELIEIIFNGPWGENDLWDESNIAFNRMLVNQNYYGDQVRPAVDINNQGDMVIAWADDEAWILYAKTQLSGEQDMKIHEVYNAHSDPSTGRINKGIDIELNEAAKFGISWQIGRLFKAKRFDLISEEILEVQDLEKHVDRDYSMDTKIAIDSDGAMVIGYQWLSGTNQWTGQLDFVSPGGITFPNSFNSDNAYLFEMKASNNREGFLVNGDILLEFEPGSITNAKTFAPGEDYTTMAYLDEDHFLLASSTSDQLSIQKYTTDGLAVFNEPIIVDQNIYTVPKQKLEVDGQGNFAIAYVRNDPTNELVIKRYNNDGIYIQTFIVFETSWSSGIESLDFAMNESGEWVIVWSDNYTRLQEDAIDDSGYAVYATRVNPQLNTFSFNLGEDINTCDGDVVELLTPGDYHSYLWTTQENTSSIEVSESGIYGVTVTSIHGGTAYDEVEVTFNSPTIDLGDDITGCESEIIIDAGLGFDSYLWSDGKTTQSIAVTTSGIYGLTATDKNGCIVSDEIEVTFVLPSTVNLGSNITDCINEVSLDAGSNFTTYLWDSGETTQSILVNESGTYGVTVTDMNGCTSYDNIEVNCILSVHDIGNKVINIYPNPTKNLVNVKFLRQYKEVSLEVFNLQGIKLMSKTFTQLIENSIRQLNVSNLPSGTYALFINGSFSGKFIVGK